MTKKELEQLNDLKEEIKDLKKELNQLEIKKIESAKDRVNSSGKEFPYILGHTTITGYDVAAEYRKQRAIEKKENLIRNREIEAMEKENQILEFINTIEDSRIRRIIHYRYIDGYSTSKIANLLHCDRSYPDKLISSYLNKNHSV